MKIRFDRTQPSTIRGAVWIVVGLVGALLLLTDRGDDINKLILLGGAIAGGLGVAVDDRET